MIQNVGTTIKIVIVVCQYTIGESCLMFFWIGFILSVFVWQQAHDSPVRTMVWSHNDVWMVTADHAGYVKYWQSNMNNVKMFMAHKEAIRGIRQTSLHLHTVLFHTSNIQRSKPYCYFILIDNLACSCCYYNSFVHG